MPQDRSLVAWKRKKSDVERTIKAISQRREKTLYLYHNGKRSPAARQLCALLELETRELQDAQEALRAIHSRIISLEKEQQQYGFFKAVGIIGLLIFSIFMGMMLVKDYGQGMDLSLGDSLTGAVVSLPEPIENSDSADTIEIPIETPIEIPTPPIEENVPPQDPPETEPQPTPEPVPEPIEEEEHSIAIPEIPSEDLPVPVPTVPEINGTINNSTDSTMNATLNSTVDIQIIPASHPGINRYTFRHALGAQGAAVRGNGNDSNGNIVTGRFIVNPLQPGTNNVNSTLYRANIGFLRNVNTTAASAAAPDITPPNVTNITPTLNSRFNFSTSIEISANVTDSSAISAVNASILLPNGTVNVLTLSLSALNSKYNVSYNIPNLTGFYNVTILANDSTNKINNTEFTNFTAVNAAPVVYWVAPVHSQSITEGGIAQIINISFNVSDANGKDDIDNSSAQIRISLAGETDRTNSSCAASASTSTTIQFNCTVGIWYFDGAGSWTINVSVRDKSSTYTENRSTTFELLSTTAMTMSPNALTWATLELGRTNQTANNDPIRINNTGNKNIAVGGITVTGYNLQGITTLTDFINAENFSIFPVNNTGSGGPIECNGTQMFNGTSGAAAPQTISVANITRGNNSIDDGTAASGQEELFVCLRFVPLGITRQSYDTSGLSTGPWTIAVS